MNIKSILFELLRTFLLDFAVDILKLNNNILTIHNNGTSFASQFSALGVFGQWSTFTECDVTCGGGEKSRNRTWIIPEPHNVECPQTYNTPPALNETEVVNCNVHPCPSMF